MTGPTAICIPYTVVDEERRELDLLVGVNMLFTAHVKGHGAVESIYTDIFKVCVVEVHRFVSYAKLIFPTYRPLSLLIAVLCNGGAAGSKQAFRDVVRQQFNIHMFALEQNAHFMWIQRPKDSLLPFSQFVLKACHVWQAEHGVDSVP